MRKDAVAKDSTYFTQTTRFERNRFRHPVLILARPRARAVLGIRLAVARSVVGPAARSVGQAVGVVNARQIVESLFLDGLPTRGACGEKGFGEQVRAAASAARNLHSEQTKAGGFGRGVH